MNTIISMKTFDFVFPDEDKLDLNEGAVDVDDASLPSVEDEKLKKITWVDIQVALSSSISNRDWVWTWWFPILRLLILIKLTKIDLNQFEQIIISCIKIIFIYICIYQNRNNQVIHIRVAHYRTVGANRSPSRFRTTGRWTGPCAGSCDGISTFNFSFGSNLWSFDSFHLSYATCYLVQIIVGTISFNFLVFSKLCSHHHLAQTLFYHFFTFFAICYFAILSLIQIRISTKRGWVYLKGLTIGNLKGIWRNSLRNSLGRSI